MLLLGSPPQVHVQLMSKVGSIFSGCQLKISLYGDSWKPVNVESLEGEGGLFPTTAFDSWEIASSTDC